MNSQNLFQANGYHILRSVIPSQIVESLLQHALTMARQPALATGDNQVPGTPAVYADPRMELLLARLTPMVEAEAGVTVFPTYSYFRVYKKGDRLTKHKDRPSCEISLSVSLGYDPDEPWPLWVEGGAGATPLRIIKGDAVIYKGTEVAHWREEFQGNYAAQVFLHYVDQQGPYREWRFDKREAALNQSGAR